MIVCSIFLIESTCGVSDFSGAVGEFNDGVDVVISNVGHNIERFPQVDEEYE